MPPTTAINCSQVYNMQMPSLIKRKQVAAPNLEISVSCAFLTVVVSADGYCCYEF